MNPGKLNKRITFLSPDECTNRIGSIIQRPEAYKTVWASIKPVRGTEKTEMQKLLPEVTHEITTRYHKDITPDMQIAYKDRVFDIVSVINVNESGAYLEISCKEQIKKVVDIDVYDI